MKLNTLSIVTVLLLACSTYAQVKNVKLSLRGIRIDSVGVKIGYTNPKNIAPLISFGLIVPMGLISKSIHVGTTLDYWSKTEGSILSGKFTLNDLIIGANTSIKFTKINNMLSPYTGVGIAFHLFSAEVENTVTSTAVSDSEFKFGLDAFGGVIYKYSKKIEFLAEARARFVSDFGQFDVKVGGIYKF